MVEVIGEVVFVTRNSAFVFQQQESGVLIAGELSSEHLRARLLFLRFSD